MERMTEIFLEQEVLDIDIHEIAEKFTNQEDLDECMKMIQKGLNLISRRPDVEGKPCEYEPLKSAGFRKVKLYSSKALEAARGEKPDLRIIYRYLEAENVVRVESIGFRLKTRPRPDNDPYSRAEKRVTEKY